MAEGCGIWEGTAVWLEQALGFRAGDPSLENKLGLGGLKGHAEYVPHEGGVTHFLSYEGNGT